MYPGITTPWSSSSSSPPLIILDQAEISSKNACIHSPVASFPLSLSSIPNIRLISAPSSSFPVKIESFVANFNVFLKLFILIFDFQMDSFSSANGIFDIRQILDQVSYFIHFSLIIPSLITQHKNLHTNGTMDKNKLTRKWKKVDLSRVVKSGNSLWSNETEMRIYSKVVCFRLPPSTPFLLFVSPPFHWSLFGFIVAQIPVWGVWLFGSWIFAKKIR